MAATYTPEQLLRIGSRSSGPSATVVQRMFAYEMTAQEEDEKLFTHDLMHFAHLQGEDSSAVKALLDTFVSTTTKHETLFADHTSLLADMKQCLANLKTSQNDTKTEIARNTTNIAAQEVLLAKWRELLPKLLAKYDGVTEQYKKLIDRVDTFERDNTFDSVLLSEMGSKVVMLPGAMSESTQRQIAEALREPEQKISKLIAMVKSNKAEQVALQERYHAEQTRSENRIAKLEAQCAHLQEIIARSSNSEYGKFVAVSIHEIITESGARADLVVPKGSPFVPYHKARETLPVRKKEPENVPIKPKTGLMASRYADAC